MELTIILFPLALLAFPVYYLVIPAIKDWYIENHTELGQKLQQIRNVGKEWKELKEHQEMLSQDPIALEHYKRKAAEREKQHKEYDKLLWEAEAKERKKLQDERLARILEEEEENRKAHRESLRQKELHYYNVSQSFDGTKLNPTQRLTRQNGAVLREHPTRSSQTMLQVAPYTIVNCTGWVEGQRIEGNSLWYAVKMGTDPVGKDYYNYVWSGTCTDQHKGGLHDFNEYEEETFTIKSMDGTSIRHVQNKTIINTFEDLTEPQVAKAITMDRISAGLITADKIYVR